MKTEGVARRIRRLFPNMKVVFILRNPIERAISNYRFSKQNGLETLSFDEAIAQEDARTLNQYPEISTNPFAYKQRGLYAKMLDQFVQELPQEQIRAIPFDDLKATPDAVLEELYQFTKYFSNTW